LDEGEALLWTLQVVVDAAVAISNLVQEEFGFGHDPDVIVESSATIPPGAKLASGPRQALRELGEAAWGPVLSALNHVLVHCSEPLIVAMVVEGYESFMIACGILGLENALDGLLGSLCRFSLPAWHGAEVVVSGGGTGRTRQGFSLAPGWTHVG
ncbi:unnamed protein product, partial [Choristocarpus tenellus]